MLPLKFLWKHPSLSLPSFSCLLASLGIPWLVDASLQSLPPSSQDLLPRVSLHLFSLLIKTLVIELRPTLV